MKICPPSFVKIELSITEAERLREALEAGVHKFPALSNEAIGFKHLSNMIFEKMRPEYIYQRKCEDCFCFYDVSFKRELTEKEVNKLQEKLGVCPSCMDDYK